MPPHHQMDNRSTLSKVLEQFFLECEARGPSLAVNHLQQRIPNELFESNDHLRGIANGAIASSFQEKRNLIKAAGTLIDAGFDIPMEILFRLGVPKRGFAIKANFINGRLGDTLGQLANLLHASEKLDLVLFVNPRLSSKKTVLVSYSTSFDEEIQLLDASLGGARTYLDKVAREAKFNRSIVQDIDPIFFDLLPPLEKLPNPEVHNNNCLTIHVRGGDALFAGSLNLPPLRYYINAIKTIRPKKVFTIVEPKNPQDHCDNPVPEKILEYCNSNNISCLMQSSEDLLIDAATLFYAHQVVASNSSFSKWLPVFGNSTYTAMPTIDANNEWLNDPSIHYAECYEDFDGEAWQKDLNYRLQWVGE